MPKGIVKKNTQGYNYKYADLAQIHEYLESEGLRYTQYIETLVAGTEAIDYVHTIIYSKDKDGKWVKGDDLRGCRVVNAELQGKSNSAQEAGSGLTYARRYSLLLAFGLATDDDDAESLTRPPKTSQGQSQIDFAKVRANIKEATTMEELNQAVKNIPEPLKKYFVDDYNKMKEKLNG